MKTAFKLSKVLAMLLAILLLVGQGQHYLFRNVDRASLRVDGFRLEEPDSLDVLFLGASEIYYGFSSVDAYARCGFTSYPYTIPSCPVTLWKPMLEEALRTQSPQLIVVELSSASEEKTEKILSNAALHYLMDGMPLSLFKIKTLEKLLAADGEGYYDDASAFLVPFVKYHDNWKDFETMKNIALGARALEKRGYAMLRGECSVAKGSKPNTPVQDITGDYSELPLHELVEEGLLDFMDYCRGLDIPVLFTRFPHRTESENIMYPNYQRMNTAVRLVREQGFPVLDLEYLSDEIGIDMDKDYCSSFHLNLYGQQKLTAYLADYLVREYDVTPRRQSEKQLAEWAASVEYYELFCAFLEERSGSKSETVYAENWYLDQELEKLRNSRD